MSNIAMSNEMDLDWLARNVHAWHGAERCVSVCNGVIRWTVGYKPMDDLAWFTKSEWLSRRAELQNKPSWGYLPDWANWLAQDEDGEWWFFSEKPKAQSFTFDGQHSGIRADYAKKGEALGDWRDTLEKRPADLSEQAVTARLKEATDNVLAAAPELMTDKYKFEPFVSVEDAKISILQSDGDIKRFGGIIGRNITVSEDAATAKQPAITPSKYTKTIHGASVDVYDVLQAWGVTNPALQHLIKKALQCDQRGHKDNEQDLQDIIDSAIRAKEIG